MVALGTPGNTLVRKVVIESSMPVLVNKSTVLFTLKSCSSSASNKISSLIFGQILDMATRASRLAYKVGVAGQSVMGALDQLVTAVSGEMFIPVSSAVGAALGAADATWACGVTPASGAGFAAGAVYLLVSHGSVAGGELV